MSKFSYLPPDAQVNCLINNFKIYMKINIKTALTCFGAVTPSSGSALCILAKVTVVKTANQNTSVCDDDDDVAAYTGCPRRNVPDFGRVFLMLKYTDVTQ